MKKQIYYLTLPFFIIVIFLGSCSKNIDKFEGDIEQNALIIRKKVLQLGFDTTNMIINNETIIVEGDIILTKSALNSAKPRQATIIDISNGVYPISYAKHRNLKYYISPILISSWESSIESAFSKYQTLADFNLRFIRTTDVNEADLLIESGSPAVADSYFPSNGEIGSRIGINTSYSGLSENQKIFVLVHEIGHAIGLRHTNWRTDEAESGVYNGVTVGAYTIPGTPNSSNNPDPNSVFNSGTGISIVPSWSNFSTFDRSALVTLYPSFGPAVLTTNPTGSFPVYVGDEIEAFVNVPTWRETALTYEWFVQGATITVNNGATIRATVNDANSAGIYCKITNSHNESIVVSRSFGSIEID